MNTLSIVTPAKAGVLARIPAYAGMTIVFLCVCASAHAQDDPHLSECRKLAQSRLGLYVHSDIYPLSEKEKSDALGALTSECMKPYAPTAPAPVQAAAPPAAPRPLTHPAAPVDDIASRKATAAPVMPVSVTTPPSAPAAPAHPSPAVSSPFSVAVPPSPALAARINPAPLKPAAAPAVTTSDDATSQLEKIINRE